MRPFFNRTHLLVVLAVAALFPQAAHAYLAPLLGGLGPLLAIIAVVLGMLVSVVFVVWHRVRNLFGRGRDRNEGDKKRHSEDETQE